MESDAQILNRDFVAGALRAGSDSSGVFFNEVPAMLALISSELQYVEVNNAYADFFGRRQRDIVGHHVLEILGADAFEQAHDHLLFALAGEHCRYQLSARHHSGQNRWLDVRYLPKVNGSVIDGIYVMVADVHELYESREAVKQRNEELNRLNASLLEFSYSLSHDLKAPLTSIQGLVDLCRLDFQDGEVEDIDTNLEKVSVLAEKLAKRIEDVLHLARLDSKADNIESIQIPMLVNRVCKTLDIKKQIRITTKFEHECELRSVPVRVEAILENLLSNAIKFQKPEKSKAFVHLRTWEDRSSLFLSVEDNGIGIPGAYQDKVFELFSRMPNHKAEGSGLGLALAKRNVIRLGGNIEFRSDGEGTVFTIRLPKTCR